MGKRDLISALVVVTYVSRCNKSDTTVIIEVLFNYIGCVG